MKRTVLLAGLLTAAAIPAAAMAQPYDPACVRANQQNQATGTVLGAIGGALLGDAIGGRGHKTDGAIVGGIGGAVAGNAIAGANNHPCPEGYAYRAPPGPPPPPPGGGFWYGAPEGIHERIAFMQDRVDRAIRGGWLSPREISRIQGEMTRIRREDDRLHYQDGGRLRREDRDYMQSLLDNVSQRLHWMEHNR